MSKNIKKIVLASSNTGKLKELNRLFANSGLDIISQSEFNVTDADETGLSFIENAIIKARHACEHTQLPALADDSGLSVDTLNGAPGIYSARYGDEHGNDQANNEKLLHELQHVDAQQRTAHFICALAFMRHANDPTPIIYQAMWTGSILTEARGKNGFGYDPLFWVADKQCSSAELPAEIKNTISHRSRALAGLLDSMRSHGYLTTNQHN